MLTGRLLSTTLFLYLLGNLPVLGADALLCNAHDYPTIPPIRQHDDELTRVQADQASLNQQNVSTFTGSVVVERGSVQLRADKADYHYNDETLDASGNVKFITPDLIIHGESAHAEMKSSKANITQAQYATREHANGRARQIRVLDKQRLELEDATYTTCNLEDPDWLLSASTVHLDQENHQGTATHSVIRFKGVPFLYFPYLRFPIGDERLSGLLFPTIGTSKQHGSQLKLPYYWNIAPNYDATLTPWYMSKRGTMLQNEFRYLHGINAGQLDADYLGNDKLFGNERYRLRWQHKGNPAAGWSTSVDYNNVSDNSYLTDFGGDLNTTSTTHLERKGDVVYNSDNWSLSLLAQAYQSLSAGSSSYERLPQLRFASRLPNYENQLHYGLDAEWVRFGNNADLVQGDRFDFFPHVSLPLQNAAGFFTPKLTWRATHYQLQQTGSTAEQTPSRSLPSFNLDSGLFFERDTGIGDTPLVQTLEPRLYYVYTPFRDQSALPVFDTQRSRFSINEPFKPDYFSGADRVEDANRLTAMLTTRFIDGNNGSELFLASIGQIHYFADQRVTLPGELPQTRHNSNMVAELAAHPTPNWAFDSTLEWDTLIDKPRSANVTLSYHHGNSLNLNTAYHFQRDSLETAEAGFSWRINPRWQFGGKSLYDLLNQRNQESELGIRFDSCCWGLSLKARERYISDRVAPDTSVYLELELKGLSSLGTGI